VQKIQTQFCSQLASSIAWFEWNWWSDWHECLIWSHFIVRYTVEMWKTAS